MTNLIVVTKGNGSSCSKHIPQPLSFCVNYSNSMLGPHDNCLICLVSRQVLFIRDWGRLERGGLDPCGPWKIRPRIRLPDQ